MPNNISNWLIKPVTVALAISIIAGMLSLYNDVQANSNHRNKAEVEQYTQKELLIELNNNVLIISQDLKYARKDIDALVEAQKETRKELADARNRETKPWLYQSTGE